MCTVYYFYFACWIEYHRKLDWQMDIWFLFTYFFMVSWYDLYCHLCKIFKTIKGNKSNILAHTPLKSPTSATPFLLKLNIYIESGEIPSPSPPKLFVFLPEGRPGATMSRSDFFWGAIPYILILTFMMNPFMR